MIAVADRRAFATALDRDRNSAVCEAILGATPLELYATDDGSLLAIEPRGVARLSDPTSLDGARALASVALDHITVARGPVAAAEAFVGALPGTWTKIFTGCEMAWLAAPDLKPVAGELRCSTELARAFDDWRDAFIAEVFTAGGSPPPVAAEHLYVWTSPTGPHAMAGLLPQGPSGSRIVTVYTPPGERGRGYASALTAALSERARTEGRGVTLDVAVDDPWARRAYERAGFRAVGDSAVYQRR